MATDIQPTTPAMLNFCMFAPLVNAPEANEAIRRQAPGDVRQQPLPDGQVIEFDVALRPIKLDVTEILGQSSSRIKSTMKVVLSDRTRSED